jgi:hypothetical protein
MKRLPRKWILSRLDQGLPVQCAVTASNACYWCYLTTSGRVCRAEYGYVEDVDKYLDTIDIPKLTFASIGRLNRALERMQY